MFQNIFLQSSGVTELIESNNKMGLVVLVLATIFVGLAITLFFLDRKVKKLEKTIEEQ